MATEENDTPPVLPSKDDLVEKVVEFGHCSVNEAKVALFDSGNDADAAISAILDRKLSREIQEKNSTAENYIDNIPSTSKDCFKKTKATAYQPKRQKVEPEAKIDQSYVEKFMIDRIIQFYLAQYDNAIPLTQYFDTKWNQDFRNSSQNKGGQLYTKPYGCMRYAISVVGKYPPNDNWLGGNGVPNEEEWPVAYHGTKEVNICSWHGHLLHSRSKDCTRLCNDYQFQDKNFKLILQCRVNPKELQIVFEGYASSEGDHWLVPDGKAIRPYAICVYDQEAFNKVMSGYFGSSALPQQYASYNQQYSMFLQGQRPGPSTSSAGPLVQNPSSLRTPKGLTSTLHSTSSSSTSRPPKNDDYASISGINLCLLRQKQLLADLIISTNFPLCCKRMGNFQTQSEEISYHQ
uniref:UBA domain-containing protein n=1 Tax=Ditylenchus dipsaci TaxID=166011 RepID=A0A915DM93_9BILA